ncbi:MAG: carboxypeptidase-like regulatory domain-containing protein [Victivallaceae bacterium]|nr:carboxypeptidase-like regulatory domain-containing protein [Victivallaceae bacterium]
MNLKTIYLCCVLSFILANSSARAGEKISGLVKDNTAVFPEEIESVLTNKTYPEDLLNSELDKLFHRLERPGSGLSVILTDISGHIINKTETDNKGGFSFTNIAPGVYNVSVSKEVAIHPRNAEKMIIYATRTIDTKSTKKIVVLCLDRFSITLRGRIIQTDGTPVAGAEICVQEVEDPNCSYAVNLGKWVTVSDRDGYYQISGIPTMFFLDLGKALVNQKAHIMAVDISVIKDGRELAPMVRVPCLSEAVLKIARKFLSAVGRIYKVEEAPKEREDVALPTSKDNDIIVNEHIVINN